MTWYPYPRDISFTELFTGSYKDKDLMIPPAQVKAEQAAMAGVGEELVNRKRRAFNALGLSGRQKIKTRKMLHRHVHRKDQKLVLIPPN